MRTAYFTLAVAAALAATTANAVHLNAEPHLEADLEAEKHDYIKVGEKTDIDPIFFKAMLGPRKDVNPDRKWEP